MEKILHKAATRGSADLGWLKTHYTFSFAEYYDPKRVHFGMLRALNDDWIAAGSGFGMHPHDNMESITIPLIGAVRHQDNLGNEYRIHSGEVQLMSAGTGIVHSEFNASEDAALNLLQIWVFPNQRELKPSYAQKKFEVKDRENQFQCLVSPDERQGSLLIHQNAFFSLIDFTQDLSLDYVLKTQGAGVYVFVIAGDVQLADEALTTRDGIGVWDIETLSFQAKKGCSALIIEVPLV